MPTFQAGETLRVRGEGGMEFAMDVPADGTERRNIFEHFIAKGWLQILGTGDAPPAAEPQPELAPAKADDGPAAGGQEVVSADQLATKTRKSGP